jgi:quercetin dioxygenase-like cupin family protein
MTRRSAGLFVLAWLALASWGHVQADRDGAKEDHGKSAKGHVMVTPDHVKWGPAPKGLPPGGQLAVLSGDPTKAGSPYVLRVKLPDGYRVPPHWHPVDENVTVLKGTLVLGMGEKANRKAAKELPAGSFSRMPRGVRHFAWAKGETILQVHGVGPFEIHYVNAKDDPRKKAAPR